MLSLAKQPQLSEKPEAGVRVRECRHGLFAFMPHDKYIGRSLDWYGEYSEFEHLLFEKLLKPGHVVAEIGSNIGALTIPMAKLVGPSGRIFAFEPQRIIHQLLCANVALNGLFNVWAEQKGVGAMHTSMGVPPINYGDFDNFGGVSLVSESPEMVPIVKLDDYEWRPDFIKIDCEGMELEVIVGANQKIKDCRPTIYVENDRADKSRALIQALIDRDYDMWWHKPFLFNDKNWRGNPENVFGSMVSMNMLCVPAEYKLKVNNLRKVTDANDQPDLWSAQ